MSERTLNTILKWLLVISISLMFLYLGGILFIPMLFGLLVAFVMYPVCTRLERIGVSRYLAISCCLLIVTTLFSSLLWLLGWQVQLLKEDLPMIVLKMKPAFVRFQEALEQRLSFSMKMQEDWLHNAALNSAERISMSLNKLLSSTANAAFILFLIPIYTALFLYHRSVFVKVLALCFGPNNKAKLEKILQQTIYTYSNYIKGMVLVYAIVGILNSIGLLALGIKHAILFGMLTAIMTIIPYVGIIVSALLPISIAYITKDSAWYVVGVIGVFTFVQYLEANVIFPAVVGRQLNVSTWATLVAIVAGGIIWGVSGMILFIPFVAILKIVAEYIPEWRGLYLLLNRSEE